MHRIIYSEEFDEQAEAIGGISFIDQAIRPLIDGLERNARAFRSLETAWFRIRYALRSRMATFQPC
jgi:hypothetical protein